MTALGKEFYCISTASVYGKMTDAHPCDPFVDDTTTGSIDDNHHLEPIQFSVRDLTPEEDGLVARMEEIIKVFLDLLQVTGGDLEPETVHGTLLATVGAREFQN
jgi:hypothetical protein